MHFRHHQHQTKWFEYSEQMKSQSFSNERIDNAIPIEWMAKSVELWRVSKSNNRLRVTRFQMASTFWTAALELIMLCFSFELNNWRFLSKPCGIAWLNFRVHLLSIYDHNANSALDHWQSRFHNNSHCNPPTDAQFENIGSFDINQTT